MKIVYNRNEEKEMKALMGFEPAHNGKSAFLLAATRPTTNSYQNHS